MRVIISELFRLLFKFSFFRKRYFGIYQRLIMPLNLFKGVKRTIVYKKNIRFELQAEDWISQNLFLLGEYEENELRIVEKLMKKGDVFIDIGANIGLYSLAVSKIVGQSGKVISFEPFLKNYNLLKRNISLNHIDNIIFEKLAIFNENTSLTLLYDQKEANQGMASSYLTSYNCSEIVDAVTLDSYLENQNLKTVDLIKIDIEGGEFPALSGMEKTLRKYSPKLLIEIDTEILMNTPYTETNIIDFLTDLGYKKYFIGNNGEISETIIDLNNKNFIFIK